MKTVILIFSLLTAFTAFADKGPVGRSVTLDNAGSVQSGSQDNWFINVKNSSGATLAAGDVVILDETDDDGYSVDYTTTAGKFPHCVMNESCADGVVCECQTYGYRSDCNFTPDQNNAAAGAGMYISESQSGKIDAITSPAATDHAIGIFLDAATATGDVECFIKLR